MAVRRVDERAVELELLRRQRTQTARNGGAHDCGARVETTVRDILAQHATGSGVLLDERHTLRPPAQRLYAKTAATRVQIEHDRAFKLEAAAEHAEQCFLHPIGGGSHRLSLNALETSSLGRARNHTHQYPRARLQHGKRSDSQPALVLERQGSVDYGAVHPRLSILMHKVLRLSRGIACAAVVMGVLAAPVATHGHGEPIDLAFWGGYPSGVARCQRTIARASARCMGDVIAARQACLNPVLGDGACDTQMLNATTIAALRQRALNMVAPDCSALQLQQLRYADLSDAYRDIIDACRRADTAITSAVYAPALRGGSVTALPQPAQSCVRAAAGASARLFDFSVRAHQRSFDRIASMQLSPAEKQQLVRRASDAIARVSTGLELQLGSDCSEVDFARIYGRTTQEYLDGIAAQSGCHAQYVYVQNAILCPVTECGNGIQEPTEQCDDGNDADDDGCRGDCSRGECTSCAP